MDKSGGWHNRCNTTSAYKLQGISTDYIKLFIGDIGRIFLGETSALLIILGGIYLIYKGYVDWQESQSVI